MPWGFHSLINGMSSKLKASQAIAWHSPGINEAHHCSIHGTSITPMEVFVLNTVLGYLCPGMCGRSVCIPLGRVSNSTIPFGANRVFSARRKVWLPSKIYLAMLLILPFLPRGPFLSSGCWETAWWLPNWVPRQSRNTCVWGCLI